MMGRPLGGGPRKGDAREFPARGEREAIARVAPWDQRRFLVGGRESLGIPTFESVSGIAGALARDAARSRPDQGDRESSCRRRESMWCQGCAFDESAGWHAS